MPRIETTLSKSGAGTSAASDSRESNDARTQDALLYLAAAALSVLGAYVLLQLWRADLHVLMRSYYNGFDSYHVAEVVKGFIEHGSFFANPSVGAPGGLVSLDRPAAETLHYAIVGALGFVTRDAALSVNLYYLLTYPLTALSAVFVMRRFGVSRLAALLGAMLYTFIAFHYVRGTAHLFLAAYYLVPFTIMLALLIDTRRPPFLTKDAEEPDGYRFAITTRASIGFTLLAAAIGLSGPYWSFFACWFYVIGGVFSAVRRRSIKRLYSAGTLVGITVAAFALQMIPTWVYRMQNGQNLAAVVRSSRMADLWGLRLSQLLLPMPGHRLPALAHYFDEYWAGVLGPEYLESMDAALGFIGAVGFIALIAWLLFARSRPDRATTRFSSLMESLGVFTLAGFLLGTVGGLGAIAGMATSLLRGYNRVSVYIAFMAFFALALMYDRLIERVRTRNPGAAPVIAIAACAVVALGLLDQVTPTWLPKYESLAAQDQSDRQIVSRLEQALPNGAMVFQLPYEEFPEGKPNAEMSGYQHFRGYLHSKTLRWSFGNMRGREGGTWEKSTAALPVPEMVSRLKKAGFKAIWVDRQGYDDEGAVIEKQLASATSSTPLVSPDGQIAVYELQ